MMFPNSSERHALAALTLMMTAVVLVGLSWLPESSSRDTVTYEHPVNIFTYTDQSAPAIDADDQGRMLVAWGSRRQEAGTYGVFARLCDRWGRPMSDEIHVE